MKKRLIASVIAAAAISVVSAIPAQAYTEDGLALYIDARNIASFDPTAPTVVTDISPSAYTGSIVGGVTYDAPNGVWDFTGGSSGTSNIDMGALDFDFTNGMTVEWVSDFGTLDGWERIADFGSTFESDNIVISRHADTGQLLLEVWNSGSALGRLITMESLIVDNETAHWAVSIESDGTAHMFKNGVELETGLNGSAYLAGAPYGGLPENVVRSHGYIGRSWWGDPEFGGSMTFLRVYERALTNDEVAENFANDGITEEAYSSGAGTSGLASTGFNASIPALAGLATLAIGVALRRRSA